MTELTIGAIISRICENYDGAYWRTLFDPRQTHAIYAAGQSNIDRLRDDLDKAGAKKFRVVKNGGLPILCFDASKMK